MLKMSKIFLITVFFLIVSACASFPTTMNVNYKGEAERMRGVKTKKLLNVNVIGFTDKRTDVKALGSVGPDRVMKWIVYADYGTEYYYVQTTTPVSEIVRRPIINLFMNSGFSIVANGKEDIIISGIIDQFEGSLRPGSVGTQTYRYGGGKAGSYTLPSGTYTQTTVQSGNFKCSIGLKMKMVDARSGKVLGESPHFASEYGNDVENAVNNALKLLVKEMASRMDLIYTFNRY